MSDEPRIHVYAADTGGCGSYRLRWPTAAARAAGVDVHDCHGQPLGQLTVTRNRDRIVTRITDPPDCDIIVLQRVTRADHVAAIPTLQALGYTIVVDIDDDLAALPTGHPYRVAADPTRRPHDNRTWLNEACRQADLVTVSTPALAERYGRHGRVRVLPNCVPARYLDTTAARTWDRVGWTGSTVTHVDDLRVCGTGVRDAIRTTGATFVAVGTGAGVQDQLALDTEPDATGWVDLDQYPTVYAGLDAAIVPLQPNRFNEAKSWLKGLEAAALGVPFVASPTGPYRQLHDLGAGLLAVTPDDWNRHITNLMGSPQMRADIAGQGQAVAADWTIERRVDAWVDAWHHARTLHARRHRELRIA